jgi:two-component system response regulator HydG
MAVIERASMQVFVVDDDLAFAETVADGLQSLGWRATPEGNPQRAQEAIAKGACDVLVSDLRMPEVDGLKLLAFARKVAPECPVIIMTAFSAIDSAVECVRQGAYHYLTKPFRVAELDLFLMRALENRALKRTARDLRRALQERSVISTLIGQSTAMREVFDLILRVARAPFPVIIQGETGVGKTMFAQTLHAESDRASASFVSINCAAIPESLLESELFGHARGAFTGAHTARSGLFVEADGGTLFLDEIGDMSPSLQAKLLHALESGKIRSLGSTKERDVDVRIVAATHRDLRELVANGRFRADLLYRLEGVVIEIPPLRLRRADIPLLSEHFLEKARAAYAPAQATSFSSAAMRTLTDYPWPGNVRELEHAVNRAVLMSKDDSIEISSLPSAITNAPTPDMPSFSGAVMPIRELQRRYSAWALDQMGGRKMLTCEKLGIDSKTLAKWLSVEDE